MAKRKEEKKQGPPAYMVSFGDMMTLILTFFILLVSMAQEQQAGLAAKGLGSFLVALRSHGLAGTLSEDERASIFDEFRQRFRLPPEREDRQEIRDEIPLRELVTSKALENLRPQLETFQPAIATFEPDSARLTPKAGNYLDLLADTLRPRRGELLVLEGRSSDAGATFASNDAWLAFARAEAVRRYLIEEHDFLPVRVQARGWLENDRGEGPGSRSVDARLQRPR